MGPLSIVQRVALGMVPFLTQAQRHKYTEVIINFRFINSNRQSTINDSGGGVVNVAGVSDL